jgi:hypothetical protein
MYSGNDTIALGHQKTRFTRGVNSALRSYRNRLSHRLGTLLHLTRRQKRQCRQSDRCRQATIMREI